MDGLRDHVRQLCDEHGYTVVLNCVRAALECHLFALQAQIDDIPGRSPNEQEEWKYILYVNAPSIAEALKKEDLPSCTKVEQYSHRPNCEPCWAVYVPKEEGD